ncbi:nuclear pore assembly and biogenesis-domain-containing protein [Paraphoma chrysanthemicola]|uniref:Nuclear pore assembly and biogenesis-domain-containing protein n=1 Tax=Paraphoma chrysanthemicola TaxID=798071 RepID=A0A8K0W4J4_9PLEO|nr:nuclear pore assembly and biogenesis-domain-containing protein [Paraphoma chrysanthemicola]
MDFIQNYASLLPRLLPPSIASPLLTILTTTLGISRTLQAQLTPLLTRAITQPDVASILALLAIFFISLKILDMAYRAVMFWVKMAFRLVFWGAIVLLGLWVWNRGVDGFVDDVGGLVEYWSGEYERYSGEVKKYQGMSEQRIMGQARREERRERGWW